MNFALQINLLGLLNVSSPTALCENICLCLSTCSVVTLLLFEDLHKAKSAGNFLLGGWLHNMSLTPYV
jgi:hypothetical protein